MTGVGIRTAGRREGTIGRRDGDDWVTGLRRQGDGVEMAGRRGEDARGCRGEEGAMVMVAGHGGTGVTGRDWAPA